MALTCLLVFGEMKTIKLPGNPTKIALDEADKKKLEGLNKALSQSKSSKKSTYTSWARHFIHRVWSYVSIVALVVCLAEHIEDGLNQYVFPLAIRLAKGERFALAPIYLGSLCYRLDECVRNICEVHRVLTRSDPCWYCLPPTFSMGKIQITWCETISIWCCGDGWGGRDGEVSLTPDRPYQSRA